MITIDITDEQKNIEYKEATERIYTSFIIESSPLEVTMIYSYDSRFEKNSCVIPKTFKMDIY